MLPSLPHLPLWVVLAIALALYFWWSAKAAVRGDVEIGDAIIGGDVEQGRLKSELSESW